MNTSTHPSLGAAVMPCPFPVTRAGHVLVVDDEPEIAQLIGEMLEASGYQVTLCHSGAEALERLRGTAFDAIISDLRMPGTDGPSLWRFVQQERPQLSTRMLFVTGDTLSAAAQSFFLASGCAQLDKPFRRKDLIAKVQDLLD